MADNKQIASDVLAAIGGKENVTFATHCITRLRFNLKDDTIPQDEEIKKINGVLGVNRAGKQYQVIIGPNVDKVYAEVCDLGGFAKQDAVEENLDAAAEKKPLTLKGIGSAIMDGLSGSLTPIIPAMLAASIFKMLVAVLGPGMLNVLHEGTDLYTLFTFVGDSTFYFFPVLVGFTSAKKFGMNPIMGAMLGAILIHPTLVAMAAEGVPFKVYGIPAAVQNYSATLLPIILTTWIGSYVEKFLKKITPDSLKVIGVPALTVAIMLPLMLTVLGPIGGWLGNYICGAIIWFGNTLGPVGALIIGAAWEFLVMTGMHQVMITQMIMIFTQNGFDPIVSVGAVNASLAVTGMCLGYWLAVKDKEEKSLAMTNTIAAFIGGVTEPGIYGTGIRARKPLIGMAAGGAAGALYAALMGAKAYALVPVASFLALTAYAGGNSANFINGIIGGVISVIVAAAVTYFLCRGDNK